MHRLKMYGFVLTATVILSLSCKAAQVDCLTVAEINGAGWGGQTAWEPIAKSL